jgi:hypothetical protein
VSLELPGWVVDAFYFVGLPWPGVDEDELRGWGSDLRQFADEITTLSGLSHDAIQQLSHSDQSAFVAAMAQHWGHHHEQIKAMREPIRVFADALDIAADAVMAQKGIVIGAAITLAAAVIATQGEALVTFGIAEGEVPLEVEAAKKVISFALQELENKLLGYLINKAAAEISSHLNGTIGKMLMGGLGIANEAYALKTDTKALRSLATTIKTHARRTESSSSDAYRRSTNRKIETDGKGGRWPVAQILEQALMAIAADIFRHLPATLHQVMEDTEKDLIKAADTIERIDAKLAADAEHTPQDHGAPTVGAGTGYADEGVPVQSGGTAFRRPRSELDFETEWADHAYDRIRSDPRIEDVARTASAEAFSEEDIQQIHSHLFLEEHELDMYGESTVGRFDSNPRIAEAWVRLQDGTPHPSDFDLLRHELYESTWMRDHDSRSYGAAHQATLDAGYPWDPTAAPKDGLGYGG